MCARFEDAKLTKLSLLREKPQAVVQEQAESAILGCAGGSVGCIPEVKLHVKHGIPFQQCAFGVFSLPPNSGMDEKMTYYSHQTNS